MTTTRKGPFSRPLSFNNHFLLSKKAIPALLALCYPAVTAEFEEVFGQIGLFPEIVTLENGRNFDTSSAAVFEI